MSKGFARHFSPICLLVPLLVGLAHVGCLESSITLECEEIATNQCTQCYAEDCAQPDNARLNAASLCGVAQGSDKAACVEELTMRCESVASARRQEASDLEACTQDLDELNCLLLYEAAAQDKPRTVPACDLYL